MKKILFIAYELPPLKVGGIYRSLGFLSNLREFGYEPIIVTLSKKSIFTIFDKPNLDINLAKDLDKFIVYEVDSELRNSNKKSRIVNFFNIYFSIRGQELKGWKKNYLNTIENILVAHEIKLIFVTSPPFGILDLARLSSVKYNLPLVIDMRDAWSNWIIHPYATFLHYLLTYFYERKYLNCANAITVTSKQTIFDFQKLHPNILKSKYIYIPNGFEGKIETWENKLGVKNKITIGYVGSFYYSPIARRAMFTPWYKKRWHKIFQYSPNKQDWLYRSPYFFLKTMASFFNEYPNYNGSIQINFAGPVPEWLPDMISDFKLEKNVKLLGNLNHSDSIKFQREADLLLLTSSKIIGGKDYSIAGKTFEYFKNQKPILAFVCDGAQKEILIESGMAIICNPDDIKRSIKDLKLLFDGKIILKPNIEFIEEHSRNKLTKVLSKLFASLIK